MKKIAVVLGTRPEIIKLLSIIKFLEGSKLPYILIHSNQHYSKNMDTVFFDELQLPNPHYNLDIGSGKHAEQTGRMMSALETIFETEKPSAVIVQGDTNSVVAGALTASKMSIAIAHVEAGLRSYDRQMPEEVNRVITDHLSTFLFCPTRKQKNILLKEGISGKNVIVTGNTVVDAVVYAKKFATETVLKQHSLQAKKYILLTMHRPSNVDTKEALSTHLSNVAKLSAENNLKIIFPVHPRTLHSIQTFKLKIPKTITVTEPLGFIELLALEKFAKIIVTDSGGILEEGCILGTPTLNIRENTERPECVEVGASKTVGSDYKLMQESYKYFDTLQTKWRNPFGNGKSGQKIVQHILKNI